MVFGFPVANWGPFFAATGLTPGSLSPRRSIILNSCIQCMFPSLKSTIPSFYRCVESDFVSFLVLSFLYVKTENVSQFLNVFPNKICEHMF